MAGGERQSPRAAIRRWLDKTHSKSRLVPGYANCEPGDQRTNSKHRSTRERKSVRSSVELEPRNDDRGRPKRRTERESEGNPEHGLHRGISPDSRREEYMRKRSKPKPDDPSLAEALGLHAPFRNFGDHNDDADVHENGLIHQRKKRRKASSTTSYLELAVPSGFTDTDVDQRMRVGGLAPRNRSPSEEVELESLSGSSQGAGVARGSPEKPTKSYERRPRRKTREDRYELKERTSEKKRAAKKDGEKKHRSRKRKRKSGAVLMHDFTAQNVSHERLTVRPSQRILLR